jgi:hypothetical protein
VREGDIKIERKRERKRDREKEKERKQAIVETVRCPG